ncbi:hypothetical protein DC094_19470 [Pelagibaculum spongiae]|uniref:Uncharacterized protein n=1 Tax=Pelagibaculum spongiae TaxID=2080658 RepID=A0A2V1GXB9_9GAMM|nr:hypothetical protein DC094_19470 [Pelagibaculum spongiae]
MLFCPAIVSGSVKAKNRVVRTNTAALSVKLRYEWWLQQQGWVYMFCDRATQESVVRVKLNRKAPIQSQ